MSVTECPICGGPLAPNGGCIRAEIAWGTRPADVKEDDK